MDNPVYVQFNKELGQHYEFRPQKKRQDLRVPPTKSLG